MNLYNYVTMKIMTNAHKTRAIKYRAVNIEFYQLLNQIYHPIYLFKKMQIKIKRIEAIVFLQIF